MMVSTHSTLLENSWQFLFYSAEYCPLSLCDVVLFAGIPLCKNIFVHQGDFRRRKKLYSTGISWLHSNFRSSFHSINFLNKRCQLGQTDWGKFFLNPDFSKFSIIFEALSSNHSHLNRKFRNKILRYLFKRQRKRFLHLTSFFR